MERNKNPRIILTRDAKNYIKPSKNLDSNVSRDVVNENKKIKAIAKKIKAIPKKKPPPVKMPNKVVKSVTSRVTITGNTVVKKIIAFAQHNILQREIYWLTFLNKKGYSWVPKLISSNIAQKTITLDYRGERINKQNAPSDWLAQIETILTDLKQEGLYHNDIKDGDILVLNGKLTLVDYGWMSLGVDDFTCNKTLPNTKKPAHVFHDDKAIERLRKVLDPKN